MYHVVAIIMKQKLIPQQIVKEIVKLKLEQLLLLHIGKLNLLIIILIEILADFLF